MPNFKNRLSKLEQTQSEVIPDEVREEVARLVEEAHQEYAEKGYIPCTPEDEAYYIVLLEEIKTKYAY